MQGLLGCWAVRSVRSWPFPPFSLGADGDKGQGIAPLKGSGVEGGYGTNSLLPGKCFVLLETSSSFQRAAVHLSAPTPQSVSSPVQGW